MNGKHNMWIVKPSDGGKGNGISVHHDIEAVIEAAGEEEMVVMKYIENPLLSEGRKVDVRVWSIYTGWNPLTVWTFDDTFFKRANSEYDPDSEDRQAHVLGAKKWEVSDTESEEEEGT